MRRPPCRASTLSGLFARLPVRRAAGLKPNHGIVGEWLSILRDFGERPDFAYGRVAGDGSITWTDFRHEDGDGSGTFTQHLLQRGYGIDPTPPIAKGTRP